MGIRQMLRAPRAIECANLAKEGDAIPVSSTRPFIRDDFSSEPSRRETPYAAGPHPSGKRSGFGCPVLARIPEATTRTGRRELSPGASTPATPSAATGMAYRVDPPQSFAPHRSHSASADETIHDPPYQATPPFRPAIDDAERLPIPIRLAVRTWQFLQPYQSLLRAAAMFALVAVGGMSVALMVGSGMRSQDEPASRTAVAVDQMTPDGDDAGARPPASSRAPAAAARESAADLHPARHLDDDAEQSTTSVAPTAIGPAGSAGWPGYALITGPQAIAPGDRSTEPPITAGEANVTPAVPLYPTTSYPTLALPEPTYGPLPQARTAEPPMAVARLKGHIEEVQPR